MRPILIERIQFGVYFLWLGEDRVTEDIEMEHSFTDASFTTPVDIRYKRRRLFSN